MPLREARARSGDRERALPWIALVLVTSAAIVFWPLAPWVVLALWTAGLMRRVHQPLGHTLGDRPRLAALLTVSFLVILIVPVVILVTLLVADAVTLIQRLTTSDRVQETLRELVTGEPNGTPPDFLGVVMSQADRVWALADEIAGTTAHVIIGLVIWLVGTYTFLTEGHRWYSWIERHVPLRAAYLRRFVNAFDETGHGLFVGIVGAGLAQATLATIVYLALGVPQPFALGFLTLGASVIPAIGTAIVWIPVAAGLALTGRPGAAMALVFTGVAVIGTIDNFIRPYLARRGHLQLPTYVVLLSMFGGIQLLGGWGLVLAPLVVRLAKEAISIQRERAPRRLARDARRTRRTRTHRSVRSRSWRLTPAL